MEEDNNTAKQYMQMILESAIIATNKSNDLMSAIAAQLCLKDSGGMDDFSQYLAALESLKNRLTIDFLMSTMTLKEEVALGALKEMADTTKELCLGMLVDSIKSNYKASEATFALPDLLKRIAKFFEIEESELLADEDENDPDIAGAVKTLHEVMSEINNRKS